MKFSANLGYLWTELALPQAIRAAKAAGAIQSQPMEPAGLDIIQPGQFYRRTMLSTRLAALRLLGRPKPDYHGFHLAAAGRRGSVRLRVRNFLGLIRRHFRR